MNLNDVDLKQLGVMPHYAIWATSFWQTWWGYACIALFFLCISSVIALIVYWIRWRRNAPEAILDAQLRCLTESQSRSPQESRLRYGQLTTALKIYVRARQDILGVIPHGVTDKQLLDYLRIVMADQSQVDALAQIMLNAEAAKFARMPVVEKLLKQDIARTRTLMASIVAQSWRKGRMS